MSITTAGPPPCIMKGARVGPRVKIGDGSVLRENCVVGGWGFGLNIHEGKPPLRTPHIGGVIIGQHVEIGALTTVCSGTVEPTIIENHVKIDDHVHVGHNCHIEERAIITAGVVLGGSCRIGKAAWLGLNCTVLQHVTIGAGATVGIGAVVFHDVPPGAKVIGNPARLTPTKGQEPCAPS